MAERIFDKLKELLTDEKYDEAIALLPTIREKQAKTASDYIALAKTYGKAGNFEHAEKLFKKAYRLRPSKLMYHEVMDMCLETGHIKDAEEYLSEYANVPAHDEFSRRVYNYRILKKKEADRKAVIEALKEINDYDYTEKWDYELAKQYYKAGMEEECKAECEKIVNSFEMSPVASKAGMLLAYYNGEVTADEIKSAVPARFRRLGEEVREAEEIANPEESVPMDPTAVEIETAVFTEPSPDAFSSEIIGAETSYGLDDIAKGVRDIIEEERTAEPEIQEISAEHSAPEIEEIVAENSEEDSEVNVPEDFPMPEITHIQEEPEVKPESSKEENDESTDDKKNSRTLLEEGFMRELNARRFERKMPQYQLYEPQNSFSPEEVKEGKIRSLIAENNVCLEDICRNFLRMEDTRRSILKSLDLAATEKSTSLYFVVTGEAESGKSTLAVTMIRLMHKTGVIRFEKTAKIKADKLNKIDPEGRAKELEDCNLLVEEAGKLTS